MKCKYCKKEIADISFSFIKGEDYYHNEICYLNSIKKDYNKKINDMLKYYFSFNDNTLKVPSHYYMNFNKLRKEMNDDKYTMFFLYNSRDIIYDINNVNRFKAPNNRMYKVWEYLRECYYDFLPDYYKKSEDISHLFLHKPKEYKTKPRHINRLLEED